MTAPMNERPERRCGRTLPHLAHLTLQDDVAYQCHGVQMAPESTAPMSGEQLAETAARADRRMEKCRRRQSASLVDVEFLKNDVHDLVAEVERLAAEVDKAQRQYIFDMADLKRRVDELLAERHATNEALDDAVAALRARDGRFHPEGRAA